MRKHCTFWQCQLVFSNSQFLVFSILTAYNRRHAWLGFSECFVIIIDIGPQTLIFCTFTSPIVTNLWQNWLHFFKLTNLTNFEILLSPGIPKGLMSIVDVHVDINLTAAIHCDGFKMYPSMQSYDNDHVNEAKRAALLLLCKHRHHLGGGLKGHCPPCFSSFCCSVDY